MSTSFFALQNLSSEGVTKIVPWEFKPNIPEIVKRDKSQFIEWGRSPQTRHAYYSAYEGVDPNLRLSKLNTPLYLHGFVVDYDADIAQATLDHLAKTPTVDYFPNYYCRTFSGGARLVWQFEDPVSLYNVVFIKEFLKIVAKKLKINKLLPGFDDDAFFDPFKYYEVGHSWTYLNQPCIRSTYIHQWLYEAGDHFNWEDRTCRIPMDQLLEEINRQYPGQWTGDFFPGARGKRFWVPGADNDTAAVVRDSGMQCFTGPSPFVPWATILGLKFVDKYSANQIGSIIGGSYYDGIQYWKQNDSGDWNSWGKEDFKLHLRVKHGLRTSTGKKDFQGFSELESVMHKVHELNRIEAALPFIHQPMGIKIVNGQRYLNTSRISAMPPCEDNVTQWGDRFPWLAKFLDTFFYPHDTLEFFLAWLWHFYVNAYKMTPQSGHIIFIIGSQGLGKTLLSNKIISDMVGGFTDASGFLLGEDHFSAYALSSPVMVIDDTAPATDVLRHSRYSSMLKKIAASRWMNYEQKYQKTGKVQWLGRVVVTCNADPESIKLLPDLQISMMDKVSLFRCYETVREFPRSDVLEDIIAKELPFFCRWLLNWVPPERHTTAATTRFGVQNFHDEGLKQAALESSPSYAFVELLQAFFKMYKSGTQDMYWEGTSTELLSLMLADETIKQIAVRYNSAQVASLLGQLKSRGYPFDRKRTSKVRVWKIPYDFSAIAEEDEQPKGESQCV